MDGKHSVDRTTAAGRCHISSGRMLFSTQSTASALTLAVARLIRTACDVEDVLDIDAARTAHHRLYSCTSDLLISSKLCSLSARLCVSCRSRI